MPANQGNFMASTQQRHTFLIRLAYGCLTLIALLGLTGNSTGQESDNTRISVQELASLPDEIGVAGPIVGTHQDVLVVAGGANFAKADAPDLWDLPKIYHDRIWFLDKQTGEWSTAKNRLSQTVAYCSVVSTPQGILCIGGENAAGLSKRTFLLQVVRNGDEIQITENDSAVADLPKASTGGGAAIVGDHVYAVLGQVSQPDGSRVATREIHRLPLKSLDAKLGKDTSWERSPSWPEKDAQGDGGSPKMFPLVTAQHDGFKTRLYVIGGRYFPSGSDTSLAENLVFTRDGWSFDPSLVTDWSASVGSTTSNSSQPSGWKRIADAPTPLSAGTAVAYGPAHIIIPAYATGEVLQQQLKSGISMRDFNHPGFPKTVLSYHTVTDSWTTLGDSPAGQVTTPAVVWNDEIIIASGEIRPRVRTNQVWAIQVLPQKIDFGWLNMSVVVIYLLAMLGIGVWFARKNRSTEDYFRGGKHIPWWVAGCSIFATMLSSITYMAIPAKAFAQNWVYAIGNLMILAVAPIAIYVALPFFRRLDVTSAYEYLEKRFNRNLRLLGSGSFSLFHIFRMGVVLALAALALSSVTPWSAERCVIVMGVLSIAYCTLGGIEAVVWTDTIQTFILLGGALLCLFFALSGAGQGSFDSAVEHGKFHFVNLDFGTWSFTSMAIWVVILGGLGQNLSSYTADQTVVQRYMTTPDRKRAAQSIWLNGLMAVPAAFIFFGMGTAFWMFYHTHPDKLDPAMASDRILPLFISQELPIGLAGLVVAGIFAAAQSTVSTSMNSGATTIVTDFLRTDQSSQSDRFWLGIARIVTILMGIAGTVVGLYFVDPDIKSLFDEFIAILGMFLGVLAGLFALGVTTRRANALGSLVGALLAITIMFSLVMAAKGYVIGSINFQAVFDALGLPVYRINGYLYALVGIVICYLAGYLASLIFPAKKQDLNGLTWWD